MENDHRSPARINVRSVDSAIQGSVAKFPRSLAFVLDAIVVLYVLYAVVAWVAGLPGLVETALRATDGYRPLAWVIGLVTGIGIAHVYNARIAPNVGFLHQRQENFDKVQERPWFNTVSIAVFFLALALGALEVFLMAFGGTTLSRELFDLANGPGGKGMYHWAGLATGVMVTVSLLGSRLNAWYRLSLLVLAMVSAHVYWHLSFEAYASTDIRLNPEYYPGLDQEEREQLLAQPE